MIYQLLKAEVSTATALRVQRLYRPYGYDYELVRNRTGPEHSAPVRLLYVLGCRLPKQWWPMKHCGGFTTVKRVAKLPHRELITGTRSLPKIRMTQQAATTSSVQGREFRNSMLQGSQTHSDRPWRISVKRQCIDRFQLVGISANDELSW